MKKKKEKKKEKLPEDYLALHSSWYKWDRKPEKGGSKNNAQKQGEDNKKMKVEWKVPITAPPWRNPLNSFSTPPYLAHSYPFLFYLIFFPVFHFNYKHIERASCYWKIDRDRKYSLQSSFFTKILYLHPFFHTCQFTPHPPHAFRMLVQPKILLQSLYFGCFSFKVVNFMLNCVCILVTFSSILYWEQAMMTLLP